MLPINGQALGDAPLECSNCGPVEPFTQGCCRECDDKCLERAEELEEQCEDFAVHMEYTDYMNELLWVRVIKKALKAESERLQVEHNM